MRVVKQRGAHVAGNGARPQRESVGRREGVACDAGGFPAAASAPSDLHASH